MDVAAHRDGALVGDGEGTLKHYVIAIDREVSEWQDRFIACHINHPKVRYRSCSLPDGVGPREVDITTTAIRTIHHPMSGNRIGSSVIGEDPVLINGEVADGDAGQGDDAMS